MQHTVTLVILGAVVGSLLTIGAIMLTGGWYEYRVPPFDFPRLAADHCEPVNGPGSILYFRCPRFVIR